MKKVIALLVLVLIAGSCKNDDPEILFGSIEVTAGITEYDGQSIQHYPVSLYDIDSELNNSSGELYVTGFSTGSDHVTFAEVNPGNYKVWLKGTPYWHAVQVKAGETAKVTIN